MVQLPHSYLSSLCPFFFTETLQNPKRKQKYVVGIKLILVLKITELDISAKAFLTPQRSITFAVKTSSFKYLLAGRVGDSTSGGPSLPRRVL